LAGKRSGKQVEKGTGNLKPGDKITIFESLTMAIKYKPTSPGDGTQAIRSMKYRISGKTAGYAS
jgi:hypothetical protein